MGAAPTIEEPLPPTRRSGVGVAAFVFVLAVALTGIAVAWRIDVARRSADDARKRAEQSEQQMREKLRQAWLETSRARRESLVAGHRLTALTAAEEAAKIAPSVQARDEVIAALALHDLTVQREWSPRVLKDGAIGVAADANRYVAESGLGRFEVRQLSDDALLREYSGTTSKLRTQPVFSEDGTWFAARNTASELLIWHESKADPLWKLAARPLPPAEASPHPLQPDAFSPDGDLLASALPGGGITIHRTDTGAEIARVSGNGEITHLSFSPDGLLLAAGRSSPAPNGAFPSFIRIVDGSKFTVLRELKVENGFRSFSWSGSSDKILVTGDRIEVFRAKDLKRCASFSDPTAASAWFGPATNIVLSVTPQSAVCAWDTNTARPLLTASASNVRALGASLNGSLFVTASEGDKLTLRRWQLPEIVSSTAIDTLEYRADISPQGSSLDYSPDGRWLVTSLAGHAFLRRSDSGKIAATIPIGKSAQPVTVAFSTFSDRFYASSRDSGLFRVAFKAGENGKVSVSPPESIDAEPEFVICDVSDDGRRVLLVSPPKNEVKIVELGPPQNTIRWKHTAPAHGAFLNSGRSTLVNGSNHDGSTLLAVRNSSTADVEMPLPFSDGSALRVSPDRRTVWISTGANKAVVQRYGQWSAGLELPPEVQTPDARVAFAYDSPLLAVSEQDRVWLLDAEKGTPIAHLPPSFAGKHVQGLEFAPDDTQLAIWWDNGTLTRWDLKKLRQELTARRLSW